jgi:hypothetical protein
MSNDEAEALMNEFEKWDNKYARDKFLHRMEHKLNRKYRRSLR